MITTTMALINNNNNNNDIFAIYVIKFVALSNSKQLLQQICFFGQLFGV